MTTRESVHTRERSHERARPHETACYYNLLISNLTRLGIGTGWRREDKEQEAKDAGAEHVGLDDYIKKIKEGWTDVDVIITMPSVMAKVGALGRVLGPRGLMPNPKSGTVTQDVGKAVADVKKGKIDFKVDKYGIIHTRIGRISFDSNQIVDNADEVLQTLLRLKPSSSKGTYLKSISLSSTMSPGVKIDPNSIELK